MSEADQLRNQFQEQINKALDANQLGRTADAIDALIEAVKILSREMRDGKAKEKK